MDKNWFPTLLSENDGTILLTLRIPLKTATVWESIIWFCVLCVSDYQRLSVQLKMLKEKRGHLFQVNSPFSCFVTVVAGVLQFSSRCQVCIRKRPQTPAACMYPTRTRTCAGGRQTDAIRAVLPVLKWILESFTVFSSRFNLFVPKGASCTEALEVHSCWAPMS